MSGLLFSAPMVRALREGRKTQTRRLIDAPADLCTMAGPGRLLKWVNPAGNAIDRGKWILQEHPYGPTSHSQAVATLATRWCQYTPGADLYVREAFKVPPEFDRLSPAELPKGVPVCYLADHDGTPAPAWGRYRHARFMPRVLTRLQLRVDTVWPMRLQDIDEEDAQAEGVEIGGIQGATYREAYAQLWDELHEGPDDSTRWAGNPWIWAVAFHVTAGGAS